MTDTEKRITSLLLQRFIKSEAPENSKDLLQAANLIKKLSKERDALIKENHAAVYDMESIADGSYLCHFCAEYAKCVMDHCAKSDCGCGIFEWRGQCAENCGGDEKNG